MFFTAQRHYIALCILCLALFSSPLGHTRSLNDLQVIRDTEIENYIKGWTKPILKAAGMEKESIDLILIDSPAINAFVAGGNNMFFYTGLLIETKNVGEVIGVYAHELGHISGGHLIRGREVLENASYQAIATTILGIGAAILTGDAGAAQGIMGLGQGLAASNFLSHSRIQESSADQAAITYMRDAGINPEGFQSFLGTLQDQELLPASQQVEYVRTHPLTRKRIEDVAHRISEAGSSGQPYKELWQEQHRRMRAKLVGYLMPRQVSYYYDSRDMSIPARYARAISAYRLDDYAGGLKMMDELIALEPGNPYFYEQRAQIARDFGQLQQAQSDYQKAVELMPDAALIRIDLAHVLLENAYTAQDFIKRAEYHIRLALADEPRSPRAHRLLATALGRMGKSDAAKLHLAEEALLKRDIPYAKRQAHAALNAFPKESKEYLRASDILNYISYLEKQE